MTLLVQGIAWINARTYLLPPQPSIQPDGATATQVEFSSVRFRSTAATLWLPNQFGANVYLGNVIYSSRHRSKDHQDFHVDMSQKTEVAPGHRR